MTDPVDPVDPKRAPVQPATVELVVSTPEEMLELGRRIARQLEAGDVLALNGPLGAGKTTLTRGLGAALGVRGTVTSPTFVLARTHPRPAGGAPLVHVDAYRLGSAAELDDLDIDFAGSIVVVEWAAGKLDGFVDSVLEVTIERPTGGGVRADLPHGPDSAHDPDSAAGLGGAGDLGDPGVPDSAGDPDDVSEEPVEPRRVTITPGGPRWELRPFQ